MKTIYVSDLKKGIIVNNETFAIFGADTQKDKNGNFYYNLLVGDKTGKVSAKIWSDNIKQVETKSLKVGRVVQLSGKIEEFKGQIQINIFELHGLDESLLEEFIESSEYDSDDMMKSLHKEIDSIKDKSIKGVLKNIFEDSEISRRFKYWPAAASVHHDFRSGLLQHVLEILEMIKGTTKFYKEVDLDVLKAGAILHDIGKIYELDATGVAVTYTVEGTLHGHISIGYNIFSNFAKEKLSKEKYLHIGHLILSHHGCLEYGSPVVPSTLEAVILSRLDDFSAKARIAKKAKDSIQVPQEFSHNIGWLENAKIWKGESEKESLQLTF